MNKLSLDYPAHILLLLQSVKDFTFGAFKGFLNGIFVLLATYGIASQPHETLHISRDH